MTPSREALVAAVRTNCAISDARHAREMTMCTYLLAMREYYRWERGVAFDAPLVRADVGVWLAAREAEWESLEDADYRPLPLGAETVDPYDVDAVNRASIGDGTDGVSVSCTVRASGSGFDISGSIAKGPAGRKCSIRTTAISRPSPKLILTFSAAVRGTSRPKRRSSHTPLSVATVRSKPRTNTGCAGVVSARTASPTIPANA